MKKIYFLLFVAATVIKTSVFSQQAYIKVPALATTTTNVLAPNGTSVHTTLRGCFILRANELSVIGTNTAINSVGLYLNNGTSGAPVTGTIQLYLQNTNDASYLKGSSYLTAIAPMTSVFNDTFTIPTGFNSVITMSLPASFTYTGSGLYVAYDWVTSGPFGINQAVFHADNSIVTAGAVASTTAVPASTLMTSSGGIRPNFQIGYVNTYTNEAQVYGILGVGKLPLLNATPYTFSVLIKNNAGVVMNNITPTLSITGANIFTTSITIPTLAAGATTTIAFPAYTPTLQGITTVSVTLPSDEKNNNNSASVTQVVTCNNHGSAPPVPITSFNSGVGFPPANGGLLLNRLNVPNASTLTALRLGIPNVGGNFGNSVYGVVTNNFGTILATTNTVLINNPVLGTYQQFNFATPVSLNANTNYYVGLAQPTSSAPYFPLASMPSPTNNIPSDLQATSFLTGGWIFSVTSPTLGWFAIESMFDAGVSLTVTPATSTICSGNTITLTANGANTYSWSNGAATTSIAVTPSLTSIYTVTGSIVVGGIGDCVDIKNVPITVNITPTITCPNGAICPVGNTHTLNPTGGSSTYTFSSGSSTVAPATTTNYTISGTSAAGCQASDVVVTVSVQPTITVVVAGPTIICNGQTATLTASGAATYSWNNGSLSNSIVVMPNIGTSYWVLGTFGTCSANIIKSVVVAPQSTVTAFATPSVICIGSPGVLIAYGASTYTWNTGATTQSIAISPTVNTSYTVTGVTSGVCTSEAIITQSVISCIGIKEFSNLSSEINIYPNPNNGVFVISISSITDNSTIELYNSLGQSVLKQKITKEKSDINLNHLSRGIYFIKLKENNLDVKTTRMIIQ